MKALCESSSQARRHFTRFDQVEQLVRAKQLFFCNLTESDLRSDSPVV